MLKHLVKEKEIATKRILKCGIGVHLLEAVQKTKEKQEKERLEKTKEEEKKKKEGERERRRAEREKERLKREERKAKESIIVVEEVDSPRHGAFSETQGKNRRRRCSSRIRTIISYDRWP